MSKLDPILPLNAPDGFFCIQNGRVFTPSTFPEFLNTVQNHLLVFLLNTDNLTPEQDRVIDAIQAEITHGWELPR